MSTSTAPIPPMAICGPKAAVAKAACLLAGRGVRKGDRIGVLARNDVGHALLLFACARIGAIMVPSNPEFGVQEAGYVLKHAGVAAMACSSSSVGSEKGLLSASMSLKSKARASARRVSKLAESPCSTR